MDVGPGTQRDAPTLRYSTFTSPSINFCSVLLDFPDPAGISNREKSCQKHLRYRFETTTSQAEPPDFLIGSRCAKG